MRCRAVYAQQDSNGNRYLKITDQTVAKHGYLDGTDATVARAAIL
jgi:hypothetical protein